VAYFAHILVQPGISKWRRIFAIVTDLGFLSYGIHVGGELAALFYPIYLWVIFGNGFRFGLNYLLFAAAVGVTGFAAVAATTEYWLDNLHLSSGLAAALVILPLYAGTLIRKLSKARQQAEEANRAKTQFLASVSHELRTPLNAIIGFSDLLRDSSLSVEQREMTRTIGVAGRSLLTLINSILDFSRIESGRAPTHVIDFDLYALVANVRAMLAAQAHAKALSLTLHITARTPRIIRWDRQHLEEILINLAGNAVKFTPSGYVTIYVDAMRQEQDRGRLRIEVSDTGIGIAPEAQGRIFESFTQADETIIDRFGGTGLGLAIVKQLVERQGGTIGVQSAPGKGSTFWFELEVAVAAQEETESADSRTPVAVLSNDEELLRRLQMGGCDCRFASSPAQVVELLEVLRQQKMARSIVVVDEQVAGAELETLATRLHSRDFSCARELVLVRVANPSPLSSSVWRLFTTTIARPIDELSLATAMTIAEVVSGFEQGEEEQPDMDLAGGLSLNVLIAEDNHTNQMVISKILERAGHYWEIVSNGEAALDALEKGQFDLVLMDVNMPILNGIETTKLYRFSSLGQHRIPIIALTADATAEIRARCEEAGMDACVTKPVEAARLLKIIESLVAEHEPASSVVINVVEPSEAPAGTAPVDFAALSALEDLGGEDFVEELISHFVGDSVRVLSTIAAAVASANVQSFREEAHALRSAAGNIGAQGIYQLCLAWRQAGAEELTTRGSECVRQLQQEFERVSTALQEYLVNHASQGTKASAPAPAVARVPKLRVAQ
jgi:two-component system sensor histidine kinase RpfC